MRRRKLLVALAALSVVVAAGTVVLWPRPERITRENYRRIRVGMTFAEVEAILGPPGDHTSGPTETNDPTWFAVTDSFGEPDAILSASTLMEWSSDTIHIWVAFGFEGTVTAAMPSIKNRITQSPLDNLLWRAKRQWHRWFP
jgi:hypothetical protein